MWRRRIKGRELAAVEEAERTAQVADEALEDARRKIDGPATRTEDQFSELIRLSLQRGWGTGSPRAGG